MFVTALFVTAQNWKQATDGRNGQEGWAEEEERWDGGARPRPRPRARTPTVSVRPNKKSVSN